MANWVTLANGVHIDLDDPHNPVSGDGSFSDLGNSNASSSQKQKDDIRTRVISIFTKDPEERKELERRRMEKQEALQKEKENNSNKASSKSSPSNQNIKRVEKVHHESKHKDEQFEIIKNSNPMRDDYHTGIRSTKDIYTLREALTNDINSNEMDQYPDLTEDMIKDAIDSGTITVYSSKPFSQGGFVSPSKMMAADYAGSGKIYSQKVSIDDIAWINTTEGQIAKTKK